jgi:FkbM family methyltransferase
VGAHHGIITQEIAMWYDQIFSFEPQPENYAELIKDLPSNVVARNIAIGQTLGFVQMEAHGRNSGCWHAVEAEEGIPVYTLDLLDFSDVDLIKLDVEGMEYAVLMGASELIQRDQPMIVLEDNSNRPEFYGIPDDAIPNLMESWDYELRHVDNKDFIWMPK